MLYLCLLDCILLESRERIFYFCVLCNITNLRLVVKQLFEWRFFVSLFVKVIWNGLGRHDLHLYCPVA